MLTAQELQSQKFDDYRRLAKQSAFYASEMIDEKDWQPANHGLAEAIQYLRWIELELENGNTDADHQDLHDLYLCRGTLLMQQLYNVKLAESCFKMVVTTLDKLQSPTDTQRRQTNIALNYLININADWKAQTFHSIAAAKHKKMGLMREYLLKACDILEAIQEKTNSDKDQLSDNQKALSAIDAYRQRTTDPTLAVILSKIEEIDTLETPLYFRQAYLRNVIAAFYKKPQLLDSERRSLANYLSILELDLTSEEESMDGSLEHFEIFILNIPSTCDTLLSRKREYLKQAIQVLEAIPERTWTDQRNLSKLLLRLKAQYQTEINQIPTDIKEYAKRAKAPLEALIKDINIKIVGVYSISQIDDLREDYDTIVKCEQEIIESTQDSDTLVEHLYNLMNLADKRPNARSSVDAVSDTTYPKLTGITQASMLVFLKVLQLLTEDHQMGRTRLFLEGHYKSVIECLTRNPINIEEYYDALASCYELLSNTTEDALIKRNSLFAANENLQKIKPITDGITRRIAKNLYNCAQAKASLDSNYIAPLLDAIEILDTIPHKTDGDYDVRHNIFQTLLSHLSQQAFQQLNIEFLKKDKLPGKIIKHLLSILDFIQSKPDTMTPEITQAGIDFVGKVCGSIKNIEEETDISDFITFFDRLTNIVRLEYRLPSERNAKLEQHYQNVIQCLEENFNHHANYHVALVEYCEKLYEITANNRVKRRDACMRIVETLRKVKPVTDEIIRKISVYLLNSGLEQFSLNRSHRYWKNYLVEAATILDRLAEKTDDDWRTQVLSLQTLVDHIGPEDFNQQILYKKQSIGYLKKITHKTEKDIIKIAEFYCELAEHYQSDDQSEALTQLRIQAWIDAVIVLNDLKKTTDEHKRLLLIGLSKLEDHYKTAGDNNTARQYRNQILPLLESITTLEYEEIIKLVGFYQEIINEEADASYIKPDSLAITTAYSRKGIMRLAQIPVKNPDDVKTLTQLYGEIASSYPTASPENNFYAFAHLFFSDPTNIGPIMKKIRIFEASLFTVANPLRQDFRTFLQILISDPDCIPDNGTSEQLENPAVKQALQEISDSFNPVKAPRSLLLTAASSPYTMLALTNRVMYLERELDTLKKEHGTQKIPQPMLFSAQRAVSTTPQHPAPAKKITRSNSAKF